MNLFASTSGTDSDWIVKLIDVYPDEVPSEPPMSGYQLPIAMDIFRGRYRESIEHPSALAANKVLQYRFALPMANHVFLPGHRIMVQIQSSWFPLYDRNPQTYVDNIFLARPQDYHKATQRVFRSADVATFIDLPVVEQPGIPAPPAGTCRACRRFVLRGAPVALPEKCMPQSGQFARPALHHNGLTAPRGIA